MTAASSPLYLALPMLAATLTRAVFEGSGRRSVTVLATMFWVNSALSTICAGEGGKVDGCRERHRWHLWVVRGEREEMALCAAWVELSLLACTKKIETEHFGLIQHSTAHKDPR